MRGELTQLALSADLHHLIAIAIIFLGSISVIKTDELEANWTMFCSSA